VNGAGAAGVACLKLIQEYGVQHDNCIMCDSKGVIYKGRKDGMNEWKEKFAVETEKRSLIEACTGADLFVGVSQAGAMTKEMVKAMNKDPIIFAMANPDPEITPEEAHEVRDDCIFATGRSDYPNQINNVMCFPFLFRGALDVRASEINEQMKMAASKALAQLTREEVPEEVAHAYEGRKMKFGKEYIIPTPFDPRLIHVISLAVAKAAVDSGVAHKPISDWGAYEEKLKKHLKGRL